MFHSQPFHSCEYLLPLAERIGVQLNLTRIGVMNYGSYIRYFRKNAIYRSLLHHPASFVTFRMAQWAMKSFH